MCKTLLNYDVLQHTFQRQCIMYIAGTIQVFLTSKFKVIRSEKKISYELEFM